MKKIDYLFSIRWRLSLFIIWILYIAYQVLKMDSFQTSLESYLRPYLAMILISALLFAVATVKKVDWKKQIRIIALVSCLVLVLYVTVIQLNYLFDGVTALGSRSIAKSTTDIDTIQFKNMADTGTWAVALGNMHAYYRIGKIILLDVFAVFGFVAVNYTLNHIED